VGGEEVVVVGSKVEVVGSKVEVRGNKMRWWETNLASQT
jgi:hypothetical protein